MNVETSVSTPKIQPGQQLEMSEKPQGESPHELEETILEGSESYHPLVPQNREPETLSERELSQAIPVKVVDSAVRPHIKSTVKQKNFSLNPLGKLPLSHWKPEKIEKLRLKSKHTQFQIAELAFATNNFNKSQLVGEGGFGKVFHGILPGDKLEVAVKVLKRRSFQCEEEFLAELEFLSRLQHKNLVKLHGFCFTAKERMLVYEFVRNGSLFDHLHGRFRVTRGPLSWSNRVSILLGAAQGLKFLHSQNPTVLHRDIKPANILVTPKFSAKVCDFGGARLIGDLRHQKSMADKSENRAVEFVEFGMGTKGYIAPEALMSGEISTASDVFSFGVLLLEILTGKQAFDRKMDKNRSLVSWSLPLLREERWSEFLDPFLMAVMEREPEKRSGVVRMGRLAFQCLEFDPMLRPTFGRICAGITCVHTGLQYESAVDVKGMGVSVSGGGRRASKLKKDAKRAENEFVAGVQSLIAIIEEDSAEPLPWTGGLKMCLARDSDKRGSSKK